MNLFFRRFFVGMLFMLMAYPAVGFEGGTYVTPDLWSMHTSPGQFKEMYRGIPMGSTKLNLSLTSRYRLRTNDYGSDSDFYQYVRASVDPVKLGEGTVRGSAFVRFADDINGNDERQWGSGNYYYYEDALDKELDENDLAPRVYHLKLELDNVLPNTKITGGRFYLDHLNSFQLDGLDLNMKFLDDRLKVYVFGGSTVSYFVDSDEDFFYGAGLSFQVLDNTKVSGEYIRVDAEDFDEDDYVKVRLDQGLGIGNAAVEYTHLNSTNKLLFLGDFLISPTKTRVNLEYETLRDGIDTDNSYLVNPFTYELLPENKYNRFEISAFQGLGSNFLVGAGYELRRVDKSKDEDFGNRNYDRFYGNFDIMGLPTRNTYISFKLDYWDIDSNTDVKSNERLQWGIELSQRIIDGVDVWLGTSHRKYEYDYINDRRKDDVRSYYVGGQWEPNDWFSFLVDFNYEKSEMYDENDLEDIFITEVWVNLVF